MVHAWLEWTAEGQRKRRPLRAGLTLIGGADADIPLPDSGQDQLHVWDEPPKVVLLGEGPRPAVNGASAEESPLRHGDVIRWHGKSFLFGVADGDIVEAQPEPVEKAPTRMARPDAPPGLSELPDDPSYRMREAATILEDEEDDGAEVLRVGPSGSVREAELEEIRIDELARESGLSKAEMTAWRRLKAGMFVELGLADPATARTWQRAVARGEFDPDASCRDILRTTHFPEGDPRLVQRSGRLLRDLLMAPVQAGARGATRRARGAAKSGLAFVIAQAVAIGIYTLLLVALAVLARMKWDWSADGLMDGILGVFGGS